MGVGGDARFKFRWPRGGRLGMKHAWGRETRGWQGAGQKKLVQRAAMEIWQNIKRAEKNFNSI